MGDFLIRLGLIGLGIYVGFYLLGFAIMLFAWIVGGIVALFDKISN